MFPLVAIGGVIGAVFSIAKGASWLADQLNSSKAPASVGGKGGAKAETDAKASAFDAALAAQVAGQGVPVGAAATPAPGGVLPSQYGTDYDTLARTKAGFAAYSHIGAHHGSHARSSPDGNDGPVTQS